MSLKGDSVGNLLRTCMGPNTPRKPNGSSDFTQINEFKETDSTKATTQRGKLYFQLTLQVMFEATKANNQVNAAKVVPAFSSMSRSQASTMRFTWDVSPCALLRRSCTGQAVYEGSGLPWNKSRHVE